MDHNADAVPAKLRIWNDVVGDRDRASLVRPGSRWGVRSYRIVAIGDRPVLPRHARAPVELGAANRPSAMLVLGASSSATG